MNLVQKAIRNLLAKATGFPPWNIGTTPPLWLSGSYGVSLSGERALQLSTVWGCCNILGKVVGSLPQDVVKSNGAVSLPFKHRIADVLKYPNEYMDAMQFMESMLLSFNLHGNAYAEKATVGGKITALWPLHPERMRVIYKGGQLSYEYAQEDGRPKPFTAAEILHVRNFSLDGIMGLSPISASRFVFERALAANQYGTASLKNGGRPAGVLEHPKSLGPEAVKRLRESWEATHAGAENAGKVAILWEGMKYNSIGLSPVDMQLLEILKLSAAEIAVSCFGVPLNLIGIPDKASTYASAEQFNRYFVDYTIHPLSVRFEKALTRALLQNEGDLYIKFNLDALLRGDSTTTAVYLATMVASGLMTPNEARSKLNLPPMEGGEELIVQSNMTVLEALKLLAANQLKPAAPAPAASE